MVARVGVENYERLSSLSIMANEFDGVFKTPTLPSREELWDFALTQRQSDAPLTYLEFGVWNGHSILHFASRDVHESSTFWGFDSFSDMEKSNAYLDSLGTTYKTDFDQNAHEGEDYHSSQRDSLAVLREDLSYNIGAVDLPHMRYMRIQTIRVKPGHQMDFEEGRKILKAAHEKAKIDEHMAVFQYVGGAQSGTYLVVIPWKSLDGAATLPHGKAYWDAMGDNNRDKLDKISNDSVVFDTVDIYAFAPQLSYSSERMVAADPAFWTLKPMMPAGPVTATRKPAAKTPKRP